jgi:hypothetical protein
MSLGALLGVMPDTVGAVLRSVILMLWRVWKSAGKVGAFTLACVALANQNKAKRNAIAMNKTKESFTKLFFISYIPLL